MQKLHTTLSNSSTLTTTSTNSQNIHGSKIKNSTTHQLQHQHELEVQSKQLVRLYTRYIKENDHLNMAYLARQKGVPPTLRHKVWPVLLKYHPYVISPFIDATVENEEDIKIDEKRIHNDVLKYFRIRSSSSSSSSTEKSIDGIHSPKEIELSPIEEEIIRILNASIVKFFSKWGAIVKYDSGFTWIALNLAEWFPPIANSNYVLIGRNVINKRSSTNKHLTQLVDPVIEETEFSLDELSKTTSNSSSSIGSDSSTGHTLTFTEVYERLVLVLLHSKEHTYNEESRRNSLKTINNSKETDLASSPIISNRKEILFKSGNIENRISFFLSALSKLLPEAFKLLSEEEILSNGKNNQFLTWWLKYCGAKVLNKFDRGRLWDLILGFRISYTNFEINDELKQKTAKFFKKFYSDFEPTNTSGNEEDEVKETDHFWFKPLDDTNELHWSQIDFQYQLIFVFIAILHKNEGKLLEFDQFEMIEFLNKLNYAKRSEQLLDFGLQNNEFLQKSIVEAGDLWRNWLWNEIRDEINE